MKKSGFSALACFLSCNFLLSLLIGSGYFMFVGSHPAEVAFSIVAYLSNTFMIYAALLPGALLLYFARAGLLIFAPAFACLQVALVLDVVIYKIFRFHINSMVVNIFITPGGFKTLGLGTGTHLLFLAIVAAVLGLELWFYRLAARSSTDKTGLAGQLSRNWKRLLAVLLCLVILDKGLSAWGTLYDNVYITGNLRLFPLYQPLKIRTFAGRHLGLKLDEEVRVSISKEYSKLDYPRRPLETVPPKKPLNILVVVVDSFRYDVMNKDVTPNLWAFSRKASVFQRHYSGGNCTRFGVFSILYGMYGNYWFSMLGERRGPVLIDALKEQGYDLRLFAAAELSFPEFDKTCFVNVPRAGFYDRPKGSRQVDRDIEITDEFLKFARSRKSGKPYFSFIFYDASHGGYEYPPEFGKFLPANGDVNYISVNKGETLPLFNKYRNSIGFEDSLVGRILDYLRQSGGLNDTAVLVMGDHGEAFFEKGYHGHNRGYSAEEIRVPLVFYVPGRAGAEVNTPTSHMDIAPSLMKLIGVKNPPDDYANGLDIFDRKERPFIPAFSWDTGAIVKDDYALVMPLETYGGGLTLYDPGYKPLRAGNALAPFLPYLSDFQKEAKKFYK